MSKELYEKPVLTKHENLQNLTFEDAGFTFSITVDDSIQIGS